MFTLKVAKEVPVYLNQSQYGVTYKRKYRVSIIHSGSSLGSNPDISLKPRIVRHKQKSGQHILAREKNTRSESQQFLFTLVSGVDLRPAEFPGGGGRRTGGHRPRHPAQGPGPGPGGR